MATDSFTVRVKNEIAVPDLGYDEITVNVTVTPRNDPPVNTVLPTFSGVMFTGQTLSVTGDGTWNDNADTDVSGSSSLTIPYGYQWQRADDNTGTNLADIAGATADAYVLTSADEGKYIRLKVTVQDDGVGDPGPQTAEAFSVYRGVPKIITGTETAVGTTDAQFNGTLKSLGETVSDIRFEYGTTTDYGSEISASPASLSSGIHTDTAVTAVPATLGAGITYHYRTVAAVDGNSIYGDDRTFAAATIEMPAPGNALSFGGSDSVTTGVMTAATDNLTIEAWVKWSGGSSQTVVYNGTDGSNGFGIKITPEIAVECGGSGSAVSSVQFAPGTWQHVAAVRESGGTWKLYLNGLERPLSGNPVPAVPTGSAVIGAGFSGQIDELRIWNTARSQIQIQDNMSRALTGSESGLAAYYHFDHASGTVLTDRTSGHNDGVISGSPSWTDSSAFTVWTAGTGDWSVPGNWSDGVPVAGSTVGIPSGSPTLGAAASCGNLTVSSGAALNLSSGADLSISGDAFNNGTLSAASGSTVRYPGSAPQYVMTGTYGNLILNNAAGFAAEGTLAASGTLSLNSGTLTLNGTLGISGGTLELAGGDIDYNGYDPAVCTGASTLKYSGPGPYTTADGEFPASGGPANLILGSAGGVTLHADRTLAGSFTLTSGAFFMDGYSLTVGGNWTKTGGTFDAGTGTVTFNGSSTQTVQSGGGIFSHLTVGKSGTLSLSDPLDIDGNLGIVSGILDASGQNISVGGNWSNAAVFTSGTGTVTLDGNDQTVSGDTTFYDLSKIITTYDTLTFQSGSTQTITNSLVLHGADSDNLLALRSNSDGTAWRFDPQGTWDFAYLDVKDSEKIGAKIDTTATNSISSGGNINWNVQIPVADIQTVGGVEDNRSVIVLGGTDADDVPILTFYITSLPPRGTLWQTSDGSTPGIQITAPDTEITYPGHRVIYEPLPNDNGAGIGTFGFRVNDGEYDSPVSPVTVNVAAVNDAPVITGQQTLSVAEDTPFTPAFSHLAVTDVDNYYASGFTLTVYGGADYTVGEETPALITPAPDFYGRLSVPVKVNDGAADSNVYTLSVNVTPVDDAPTAPGTVADVTVDEDAPPTVISLGNTFADIDSAAVAKSVLSDSNPAVVTAATEGDILTLTYLKDQNGTADIVIRGSADGQSADVSFRVTVNPVDDLPVWISEIEDVTVTDGDPDTVIALDGKVTDIDNDQAKIVFSAKSANTSLVSSFTSGTSLTLRYSKDRAGESEVTVTAISGGKSVSDTFSVTVDPLRYSVSGNVSYFSNLMPVPDMKIMLAGTDSYTGNPVSAETFTDASGNYLFSDAVRGDYSVTPFKNDPPDPKNLSAADAELIAEAALGVRSLTPFQYRIADITLNGRVSGLDASRLGRFTAGLTPGINGAGPVSPTWISEPDSFSFSLNADTENQDFTAALAGDVSGNYTPGASETSAREPGRITEITAEQGSVLSVPVIIGDETEILGIDIDIEYDETVLSAREATLSGGILGYQDYETAVNLNEPGRIRMAIFGYSGKKITGSGTVVNLYFDVFGPVAADSLLTFTRFDCNEIRISDGNGEREETVTGGFGTDSGVSMSLRVGVIPDNPLKYDTDGDGRVDMRDVFQALQNGDLKGAARALRVLIGR